MRKLIAGIALLGALALPGVASAHSGNVTCDSTGVVFTYNANFPANTVVTEHVAGSSYTFTPPAFAVSTHTDPAPNLSGGTNGIGIGFLASATWIGGGTIPPTTLNCPQVTPQPPVIPVPPVTPPSPPITPAPVCPAGTNSAGVSNGVLVCVTPPPVTPPPFAICPKGDKSLGVKNGVLLCQVIKIKVVHKITKIVKWVQWCPLPPKKGGVAG